MKKEKGKTKEKIKKWLSTNAYMPMGYVFIWVLPLILLVILAAESKTNVIAFKLWGSIVGVVIVVVYFVKLRAFIRSKCERELHEQNRVPVWLRAIQGVITILSFVAIILVFSCFDEMAKEITTFLIATCISVGVGYIWLCVDSYHRKPQYINRVSKRDCDNDSEQEG